MTIGACLDRWRWRALVALTVLAALLLPAMSEAACLQADLAPARVAAASIVGANQVSEALRNVPEPMKKPVNRPRHAAICQHAHCGHSQIAIDTGNDLSAAVPACGPLPGWTYERFAEGQPVAGPERPPQA